MDANNPKWRKFLGRYNSNFAPLGANDGLEEWSDFVDGANAGFLMLTIDQLIEKRVAAGIDSKYKPKLYEVKRVYFEVLRSNTERSNYSQAGAKCQTCGDSGVMAILMADGKPMAQGRDGIREVKDYEIREYCCHCGKGAFQASLSKSVHRPEWSRERKGWAFRPVFEVYKRSPCDKKFTDEELKAQFDTLAENPLDWLWWAKEAATVQGDYCRGVYGKQKPITQIGQIIELTLKTA